MADPFSSTSTTTSPWTTTSSTGVGDTLSNVTLSLPDDITAALSDTGYTEKTAEELQGDLTNAYLSSSTDLASLSAMINSINAAATESVQTPESQAIESDWYQNISDMLAGNIPQDLVTSTYQDIAERYGGTGMGADAAAYQTALLNAMNETSLGMMEKGATEAEAYAQAYPATEIWDVSEALISPEAYTSYLSTSAATQAEAESEAAQLAEQQAEYTASLGEKQAEFQSAQEQAQSEFEAEMALKEQQYELSAYKETGKPGWGFDKSGNWVYGGMDWETYQKYYAPWTGQMRI